MWRPGIAELNRSMSYRIEAILVDRAMFRVDMSAFVINVPTREILVSDTKWSFQIMAGTLELELQCL